MVFNFQDFLSFMFIIIALVSWENSGISNGKRSVAVAVHEFNVVNYGARGDGRTDDSKAFIKAWVAACNAEAETTKVVVPNNNTFLLHPLMFDGPCKPNHIDFMILGKIVAPSSPRTWNRLDTSQWIAFKGIKGLNVHGPGLVDGNGYAWWGQSCRDHSELDGCTTLAPTAMKFLSCKESSLSHIEFINSPQTHVLILDTNGMKVDNLLIKSPDGTPNTDGIHIQSSHFLNITNSRIGTGDDCISIGDYTSNIYVANVECGPGHGISIGSLGRKGNYVQVENIHVRSSSFKGTTNGARIKTWQAGRGYIRKIIFEDLKFDGVGNPLIIDQYYCQVTGGCKETMTGVRISEVIYKNVSGTSSTDIAININCSRFVPCFAISMEEIHLRSTIPGKTVTANCANIHGIESRVEPGHCLKL